LPAGIAKYAPVEPITEELFDTSFDTNVKGVLFTVQSSPAYSMVATSSFSFLKWASRTLFVTPKSWAPTAIGESRQSLA